MPYAAHQTRHAETFRALHARAGAFVIPNPWDAGTARLLAMAGFAALATTSAGYAYSRGLPDNAIGRDAMLEHIAVIAAAGELPVSADLENGFGDAPEIVAETIRLAAEAGAVGGSIEDATGRADAPIYPLDEAVERIAAAAAAARALPFPFTLTARCENYLNGRRDLADTIARLVAYRDAGADVLYAPGLTDPADIEAVTRAVQAPVNVLMGLQGAALSVDALAALGVKRISVGSALARAALGAFVRAIGEIVHAGTFEFATHAVPSRDLDRWFAASGNPPVEFER
ncbi:isocitrate lyase/phosphoenolpyruvate mutase family protein [Burkholderia multivorans]|uniref:isocitrate lyase/PEP mutase family protein n=1 Tax=Burkholderia multivorans TaxID=87883 RepID=UPI000D359ADB|nr:isocitrate lyase/phosphoenolpyruvate mutase family protein [Burkholderia multivorans]MBR8019651.1 isocitrate lyase/phosphoenolpyruvate mutase family protein [Burkholderia multivorans]MEB2508114.1 isocitrate lyase/phosphoenolpyruvate mutase family protein [Burkholderia multivorans]MEB2523083.1 isocitrate lyase/phosphoenolpyruvate mutase family protein [Burkholderia multivorans]MEB2574804.1 isocitrate lyase/phosphoenolpyruvate mutase family protein [Burkholderia multivorans]MEB2594940.1 isoci